MGEPTLKIMVKFIPYSTAHTNSVYVNTRHLFSYGTHIVVEVGGRGIGKTFDAKRYAVGNFHRTRRKQPTGGEFVWVRDNDEARRKLSENGGARFFNDFDVMPEFIRKNRADYCIQGSTIKFKDETMGYVIPSNEFQNDKGSSYAQADIVVFDEFIAEMTRNSDRGRLWKIVNTLSTIMRTRKRGKIIFLANALDRSDPFLNLCGFDNIDKFGIYLNREKDVALQYFDSSPAFKEQSENSIVGKLIKGTAFEKNMVDGEFTDRENDAFLFGNLPPRSALFAVLCVGSDNVSLYNAPDDYIYVGGRCNFPPLSVREYVRTIPEIKGDRVIARKEFVDNLLKCYQGGKIKFVSPHARAVFVDFIKNR